MSKGDLWCIDGRLWRHDPQSDDPELQTDIGQCPDCSGHGCPVEADTPTGIPPDWADCAQCGARRFYPSGQCMQYCDKKPSPTDAKDALPYPNPWVPMSNPLDIKHIGKLAEEANELGAAIARCLGPRH